jgi:hypothetical protein
MLIGNGRDWIKWMLTDDRSELFQVCSTFPLQALLSSEFSGRSFLPSSAVSSPSSSSAELWNRRPTKVGREEMECDLSIGIKYRNGGRNVREYFE